MHNSNKILKSDWLSATLIFVLRKARTIAREHLIMENTEDSVYEIG